MIIETNAKGKVMCGIAGFLPKNSSASKFSIQNMVEALSHRGPDHTGFWQDGSVSLNFGHARLSILELSDAGNQPMSSLCGRYTVCYNGEIYNWKSIRSELQRAGAVEAWRGSSDTEVLLNAIKFWGIPEALRRFRGMFAFALWDKHEKILYLARDRIGEKPLYYGNIAGNFVFASELKSIVAGYGESIKTNPASVCSFLRYGYVPEPHSIYEDIFKLPPGALIAVTSNGVIGEPTSWWSFECLVDKSSRTKLDLNYSSAIDKLDDVLTSSVAEQMIADVPVGAFLSGGIDSSTIVALMQKISQRKVRTFTIGFEEQEYNEANFARKVARHLKTEHTEVVLSSYDAQNMIPMLPEIYDEPFGDSSQIPTLLVSKVTREGVKVCLSGDAGDELFGGYNRYFWAERIWNFQKFLPPQVRSLLGSGLNSLSADSWNSAFGLMQKFLPTSFHFNNAGDKMHKLARLMHANDFDELYHFLVQQNIGKLPVKNEVAQASLLSEMSRWPDIENRAERMMAIDTLSYLPGDILVKVDRAAMANGLETRLPFLDERVILLSWGLNVDFKIRDGIGKYILRDLLSRYVPNDLWHRPKQGFGVPIDTWLRGPLKDWATDLLFQSDIEENDIFDTQKVRDIWERHMSGQNLQHALWNILSYLSWKRKWH